jgi:hypothetical protein
MNDGGESPGKASNFEGELAARLSGIIAIPPRLAKMVVSTRFKSLFFCGACWGLELFKLQQSGDEVGF